MTATHAYVHNGSLNCAWYSPEQCLCRICIMLQLLTCSLIVPTAVSLNYIKLNNTRTIKNIDLCQAVYILKEFCNNLRSRLNTSFFPDLWQFFVNAKEGVPPMLSRGYSCRSPATTSSDSFRWKSTLSSLRAGSRWKGYPSYSITDSVQIIHIRYPALYPSSAITSS